MQAVNDVMQSNTYPVNSGQISIHRERYVNHILRKMVVT